MDPVALLADHSASLPSSAIGHATRESARALLTDTIACIYAGTNAEGILELLRAALRFGGEGRARVIGQDRYVSPEDAAFVNAIACHATDYDDTHDISILHGCATIVPALVAVCDIVGAERTVSGEEFIAAMAVGLDTANRIGLAVIEALHTGWLPTTLWRPIGAAAACGRILGLSTTQMRNAFGFAYAQIHGNRQALVEGSLAKRTQAGFAAASGVRAALIAAEGLSAPQSIGNGMYGIRTLYAREAIEPDRFKELMLGDLGVRNETERISIKPYPCCRCTHPVIDGSLYLASRLANSNDDTESIDSVRIGLPRQSMGQIGHRFAIRDNPTVDAQFSAQYTAALAFVSGRPILKSFTPAEVVGRNDILRLADRIDVYEMSPENPALVPIEVEVSLADGSKLHKRVTTISGSPDRPLSQSDLISKFDDCLDHACYPPDPVRRRGMIDLLGNLDSEKDITTLFAQLR